MPTLDFLFQGSAPPSVSTYGASQTQLPQWLSDITQGIANRATDVAGQPLVQPNFPRVAGFTPDQQASFEQTRTAAGQTQGALTAAGGLQAPSAAAAPYMKRAGMSAADAATGYMNPYSRNVTDEIARLGSRNLHESILPGISDTFIRSGTFGGTQNRDLVGRAIRDTNESVLGAQSAALERGYGQALGAAGADTDRAARAGQLAGQLSNADLQQLLGVATGASTSGVRAGAALGATGAQQQAQDQTNTNVALQDFLEARGYPRDQINYLNSVIKGVPYGTSTTTSGTGPGNNFQPSLFSNLAGGGLTLAALAKAFPGAASSVGSWFSGLGGGGADAASAASSAFDYGGLDTAANFFMKRGGPVRTPMRRPPVRGALAA